MNNWWLVGEIAYLIILVIVCLKIIYDTRRATKTVAYLLLTIFLPLLGMIIYFTFGVNYFKRKLYGRKETQDDAYLNDLKKQIAHYTKQSLQKDDPAIKDNRELAYLLLRDLKSPLTRKNKVKLLVNGEEKFPEVLDAMRKATDHIHIEYYIFEEGEIASQFAEVMIAKAKEGVAVRFLYDDFGSKSIRKKFVKRLKSAGVKCFPFFKVHFILFANRVNYRNHRKIIVIDGQTAFTGGINISDKYINNKPNKRFWRDTHLRIDGPGVYYLQYIFLSDWNFCCGKQLTLDKVLFAEHECPEDDRFVQIAASGPDSRQPSILFSLLQVVYLAKEEILITTPYFIPGESMLEALAVAALSGLKVKLLVPGVSDIGFVNAASRSYYPELMAAGVEIYLYQKGFVHSKTIVADGKLSVVGTANMDYRSFELNFEVNALVYDQTFGTQLRQVFFDDLRDATKIDPIKWSKRAKYKLLWERVARLFSPIL